MLKKIVSAVIAITLVMGMCSCSENSSSEPASTPTTASQSPAAELTQPGVSPTANYAFVENTSTDKLDEKFVSGMNSFSVELFKASVASDLSDGKNVLVSPESVAFALGMVQNGADKETLRQMQNVLCKDVDQETFNKNMNRLMTMAKAANKEGCKLNIANSVWVRDRQDITPTEQFSKTCKELYDAELFKSAFDDKAVKQVNSWVNEKTDNMIPNIIDKFDENDVMYLINCVAFDSEWAEKYEEEQVEENETFTNEKGEKVKCTMLSSKENVYVSNDRAEGFIKNYKGGKYSFMAVLPNEGTDVKDYVASMTADEFAKLYNNRTEDELARKMPEYKYDHSLELSESLKKMGMTQAFSNAADFSKLIENTETYIGKVLHKTHIELGANGTKAAAATAVEVRAKGAISARKEVILDRPFVYAIMDNESGLPVFMGTVCDPAAE